MKKKYIYIGAWLGIVLNLYAIDFEILKVRLLEDSPLLKRQKLQTLIAKEEVAQANARYYPTLRVSFNGGYSKKYNKPDTPSYIGNDSLTQSTSYQNSATLSLGYDLFHFGETKYTVDAAKANYSALMASACEYKNQLLLELLEAYHQVRVATIKITKMHELNSLYMQLYSASKRLHKAGVLSRTKVLEYAKNIADTSSEIINIEEILVDSLAKMTYLTGVDISGNSIFEPLSLNKFDTFIDSFESTPSYQKAIYTIAQKEALYKASRTAYFPSLTLYGKYDFYGSDKNKYSKSLDDMEKNGYQVGLSLSWNIFDGFHRESLNAMRLLELEQSKEELQIAKREFQKNQKQLFETYSRRQAAIKSSLESNEFSLKMTSIGKALFKSGQASKIENLQNEILDLQTNLKVLEAKEKLDANIKQKEIQMSKGSICEVL